MRIIKGLAPGGNAQDTFGRECQAIEGATKKAQPSLQEVVRAEVIKLLDATIIYPISDSKWVRPIYVVPKWAKLTVVKNKDDELVPTRIQLGLRVCIVISAKYCILDPP